MSCYSMIKMALYKDQIYITGNYGKERDIYVEANLTPGTYYIICEIDWLSLNKKIILSCYSEKRINLMEKNSKFTDENLFIQTLENLILSIPAELTDYYEDPLIFSYTGIIVGYKYFVYVNNSKVTFNEEINVESENLVLKRPII